MTAPKDVARAIRCWLVRLAGCVLFRLLRRVAGAGDHESSRLRHDRQSARLRARRECRHEGGGGFHLRARLRLGDQTHLRAAAHDPPANGSWSANITSGGSDTNATRFAALLVGTNYNQACVLGSNNLPTNIYAQAAAKSVVTRPSPGVRFLSFSGYDWWVKS